MNARLAAELLPDLLRLVPGGGDVRWHVGLLVAKGLGPAMLVFLADAVARRVVMISAHVEAVNAAGAPVKEHVAQRAGEGVEAPHQHERPAGVRPHLDPKLARGGVVRVFPPGDIALDDLGRIGQDGVEFLLGNHSPPLLQKTLRVLDPNLAAELMAFARSTVTPIAGKLVVVTLISASSVSR